MCKPDFKNCKSKILHVSLQSYVKFTKNNLQCSIYKTDITVNLISKAANIGFAGIWETVAPIDAK